MSKGINEFYNLYEGKSPNCTKFYDFKCVGLALSLEEAKEWVEKKPAFRKYKFNAGKILTDGRL